MPAGSDGTEKTGNFLSVRALLPRAALSRGSLTALGYSVTDDQIIDYHWTPCPKPKRTKGQQKAPPKLPPGGSRPAPILLLGAYATPALFGNADRYLSDGGSLFCPGFGLKAIPAPYACTAPFDGAPRVIVGERRASLASVQRFEGVRAG